MHLAGLRFLLPELLCALCMNHQIYFLSTYCLQALRRYGTWAVESDNLGWQTGSAVTLDQSLNLERW